ncbi:MAG: hypothetical protein HYZ47_03565 [Simkania negevensis]|nr:hypothetical protein [Simkania negevensis]
MQKEIEEKRQEWKKRMECWQASGINGRQWCQGQGLSYRRFRYWKSRFLPYSSSSQPSFIELVEEKPKSITMEYQGAHIYLSKDFDLSILQRCLHVLKEFACC